MKRIRFYLCGKVEETELDLTKVSIFENPDFIRVWNETKEKSKDKIEVYAEDKEEAEVIEASLYQKEAPVNNSWISWLW